MLPPHLQRVALKLKSTHSIAKFREYNFDSNIYFPFTIFFPLEWSGQSAQGSAWLKYLNGLEEKAFKWFLVDI